MDGIQQVAVPNTVKLVAYRDPRDPYGVDLYIGDGQTRGALEFAPTMEGERLWPTARMTEHQAQALMDSLWDAGFRPAGAAGSAGQAAAMQAHIEDLRMVVKAKLQPTP